MASGIVQLEMPLEDCQPNSTSSLHEASVVLSELLDELLASERPFMKTLLRYRLAGYSQDEIAKKMGRSSRTIRRMLDSLRATIAAQSSRSLPMTGLANAETQLESPNRKLDYRDFQWLRMLGQGSFARVYLAREIEFGELFALKTLKRKWLSDFQVVKAFADELETISKLNDPNVVKSFGSGRLPNGGVFLLLEHIQGVPLDFAIKNCDSIARSKWLSQIEETINRIHAAGFIHGDIRSANIFVTHDGRIRLLDFGFSKLLSQTSARKEIDLNAIDEIRQLLQLD